MISEKATELSDEEINSLTQAILKRHGIDFTCYELKSLKRRVGKAISVLGLESIHELWIKILKEPGYVNKFMNEVSVGLTSMFRDPIMWKSLKKIVYERKEQKMKVWHAGCSTGEEVFSFAILLKELNIQNDVNAFASDISLDSIEIARKGTYNLLKFKEFEGNFKEYNTFGSLTRYSRSNEQGFTFDNSLLNHASFRYHNLITDNFDEGYDIIFCRNVMIYFDSQAKIKLLEKFYKALKPGGFLIIGFFDALLPFIDENKFIIYDMNAKIFQAK